MENLVIILLVVIAYILWRIYRQREDEKAEIVRENLIVELEKQKKEELKDYPHLYGRLEGNWLEVFDHHVKNGLPLLKLAFLLYLQESTKFDFSEGAMKFDNLWDLSEELLEHLEKYHEGSITEHEIAVCTYWQIASEAAGELIKSSPEKTISKSGRDRAPIEGKKLETEPFTDLMRISSLFPRKSNHPKEEISFIDANGIFPRKSEGSTHIHNKLKALGL